MTATKQQLRQLVRSRRPAQTGTTTETAASLLREHPHIQQAHTLLLYSALPDEVPTQELLDELIQSGCNVLLPRVTGQVTMELRRYTGPADLQQGAFGIMEPTGKVFTDYAAIDVAVIPGVAFDRQGHRIGRGRGYYDHFLTQIPAVYKIGLCFSWQLVDHVPTEAHDIAMDEVVTAIERNTP